MLFKLKLYFYYIQYYGLKLFIMRVVEEKKTKNCDYQIWFLKHRVDHDTLLKQCAQIWDYKPKISVVVPLYNTKEEHLKELIHSLQNQSYDNWELCFVDGSSNFNQKQEIVEFYSNDDRRIRYQQLNCNLGISENSNRAIQMASGDYIGLLDHDDYLEPDALFHIATEICKTSCDVLYTDEDKVSEDGLIYSRPTFKPSYSPFLLRSNNYICHFFVFHRELYKRVGGFNSLFDGAQDYDFILRICEKATLIRHIPRILYHWRSSSDSTSDNPFVKIYAYDAGKRALESHYCRIGLEAIVSKTRIPGYYHTEFPIMGKPKVAIVQFYEQTKTSGFNMFQKHMNYETYTDYHVQNVPVCCISEVNQIATQFDYIVILSNDCTPCNKDWITNMLEVCQLDEVAVVGGKILSSNYKVYSTGLTLNRDGDVRHIFQGLPRCFVGYRNKAITMHNVSAVSGKYMMIKSCALLEVAGIDPLYKTSLWDVDLCLKVKEGGYQVVYQPSSMCIIQSDRNKEILEQVDMHDQEYFKKAWRDCFINGDAFYNINLNTEKADYSLVDMDSCSDSNHIE